jgi:hypothetical protein
MKEIMADSLRKLVEIFAVPGQAVPRTVFTNFNLQLEFVINDSANNRQSVVTPTLALNNMGTSNNPSPSLLLDEALTSLTACFDLEKQNNDGHSLVPFRQMFNWITSCMNCRDCRGTQASLY